MSYFIPKTMQDINNWLTWRLEPGNNKPRKTPYNPIQRAKQLKSINACTYEEAFNYWKYGDYDGIGFYLTKECNLVFIDLDNCIDEEGNYSQLAEDLTEKFKDCYIEVSHSERGLHIICKGNIPQAIKRQEIEIYSQGRYIALTGNAINENEPIYKPLELEEVYYIYKPIKHAKNEKQSPTTAYNPSATIEALEQKIKNSKQGEKWERLHKGNIDGYKSMSEGAQAYIDIVNYFSCGNDELTRALFSLSNFAKYEKYQKAYYIDRMIENAKTTANYTPTPGVTRNRTRINGIHEAKRPKTRRKRLQKRHR